MFDSRPRRRRGGQPSRGRRAGGRQKETPKRSRVTRSLVWWRGTAVPGARRSGQKGLTETFTKRILMESFRKLAEDTVLRIHEAEHTSSGWTLAKAKRQRHTWLLQTACREGPTAVTWATDPLLRATLSLSGLLDRSNETEIKRNDAFLVLESSSPSHCQPSCPPLAKNVHEDGETSVRKTKGVAWSTQRKTIATGPRCRQQRGVFLCGRRLLIIIIIIIMSRWLQIRV